MLSSVAVRSSIGLRLCPSVRYYFGSFHAVSSAGVHCCVYCHKLVPATATYKMHDSSIAAAVGISEMKKEEDINMHGTDNSLDEEASASVGLSPAGGLSRFVLRQRSGAAEKDTAPSEVKRARRQIKGEVEAW